MIGRRWIALGVLLGVASACERTAEGVKQDTAALAASAERGAAQTKETLSNQLESFKAESQKALDDLSTSVNSLGDKAEGKANEGRDELKRQLAETKKSLDGASASTQTELDETRQKLKDKLAELGRKIKEGVNGAGDATEKAVDDARK
ncbi:MAG: hypothetical protein ABW217_20190 [Polyangiaceae bacterium]